MSFEFNSQEFLVLDLRLRGEREGGLEHHKLKEEKKKQKDSVEGACPTRILENVFKKQVLSGYMRAFLSIRKNNCIFQIFAVSPYTGIPDVEKPLHIFV